MQDMIREGDGLRLQSGMADTGMINALIRKGTALQTVFPDSAVMIFRYTLQQSRELRYAPGIVTSLFRLGNIYAAKGWNRKGIHTLKEAIPYCYQLRNQHLYLSVAYNDIGIMYQAMGNYDLAARLYYYAIWLAEQSPASIALAKALNNFGTMLIDLKRQDQALPYLRKAEKISRQRQDYEQLGSVLINEGLCYQRKSQDTGRMYFQEGLDIGRAYGLPVLQHTALTNLGELYLSQGIPEKALPLLLEAASMKEQINPRYIGATNTLLGETYYRLRQYDKAEHFLHIALGRAQELKLANDLITANRILADLYADKKDYAQAHSHLQAYTLLKDSLTGQEIMNNVNRLEVKYRTANKDKELIRKQLLIAQQAEKIGRKNRWIGGVAAGALVLAVIFAGVYHHYRQRQKLQTNQIMLLQQEQELLVREQEIGQLKAMMKGEEKERGRIARELHDGIGGMLATVKMYLGTMKKDYPALSPAAHLNKALHMLEDTSEEVRKTAHNLMPDVLLRHNLPKALETYCENISATGKLRIDFQVHNLSPAMDKAAELMLYRIVQELVQNIIKHAHATYAEVQLVEHEGVLSIMVEDNGTGFDTEAQHSGFGLQQLKHRVRALQGYLSITSVKGKSTTVHIEFDLEKLKLAGMGFDTLNNNLQA